MKNILLLVILFFLLVVCATACSKPHSDCKTYYAAIPFAPQYITVCDGAPLPEGIKWVEKK